MMPKRILFMWVMFDMPVTMMVQLAPVLPMTR